VTVSVLSAFTSRNGVHPDPDAPGYSKDLEKFFHKASAHPKLAVSVLIKIQRQLGILNHVGCVNVSDHEVVSFSNPVNCSAFGAGEEIIF
jgi:hypothetical protein